MNDLNIPSISDNIYGDDWRRENTLDSILNDYDSRQSTSDLLDCADFLQPEDYDDYE